MRNFEFSGKRLLHIYSLKALRDRSFFVIFLTREEHCTMPFDSHSTRVSCQVFVTTATGQSVLKRAVIWYDLGLQFSLGISEQIISECEFSLEISERIVGQSEFSLEISERIIGQSEFSLENSRQLQQ